MKLILIDSHAILHRAYHALPPLTSPSGQVINAIYGFTSMLLTILEIQQPTHLITTFDLPAPNFRQQIYTAYQGKRPEMEGNLTEQIPLVKEMLDSLKIARFEMAGFEADDVIGTLARQSSEVKGQRSKVKNDEEIETIIVTGDRDMLQLVNGHVSVLVPVKGLKETKLYHRDAVINEFGVNPEQWVDVKALKGDASDNYPGVTGIGPKTAQDLVLKYGTLENLYSKLGEFGMQGGKEKRIAEKLAEGAESAGLGKKLAQIVTDVPGVTLDLENCQVGNIDWNNGIKYMRTTFGFKTLVERIEKTQLNQSSKIKVQSSNLKVKSEKNSTFESGQMELI